MFSSPFQMFISVGTLADDRYEKPPLESTFVHSQSKTELTDGSIPVQMINDAQNYHKMDHTLTQAFWHVSHFQSPFFLPYLLSFQKYKETVRETSFEIFCNASISLLLREVCCQKPKRYTISVQYLRRFIQFCGKFRFKTMLPLTEYEKKGEFKRILNTYSSCQIVKRV